MRIAVTIIVLALVIRWWVRYTSVESRIRRAWQREVRRRMR